MGTAFIDGNEAAARIAYQLSEVIAIYPITPASPMGEHADAWSAGGAPNRWGAVPDVIEMQSEAGAAGVLHGALQTGALATTFTASQGLLLMLPNMFKIAGELTPSVIHVAARALATHALSIFGDHSDVMAARSTGWAMLCASSVQEAHDFALVSHAATLHSRVPFLHFFDGFRTSHEVNRVELIDDVDVAGMVTDALVATHRDRRLRPTAPVLRGTAQNPDVFFQAREASTPFHAAVPATVETMFDELAARTGRRYHLVDYAGAPDAERVIVMMGSGRGAAVEAVQRLTAPGGSQPGEKVGIATIRLFRPFPTEALLAALPPTVRAIAVLDRCKEPGSAGEPLFQDVVTAVAEADEATWTSLPGGRPRVIGGRYGLGSKEFTPAMARAVFDELAAEVPKRRFTVGIVDDVSHSSLDVPTDFDAELAAAQGTTSAVFYALGSDGTVGANKASVKIIGDEADLHAQGYFVYDSKKSGSMTVSHLRFGTEPIDSSYLVQRADFVACHQFTLVDRVDVLAAAKPGATVLLNAPYPAEAVWERLPLRMRRRIVDDGLALFTIDAARVARDVGLPGRINTVMQPCFFALSGVLPTDTAIAAIKKWVRSTYGRRGGLIVERNEAAIDAALAALVEVPVPASAALATDADDALTTSSARHPDPDDFVARVTARIYAGEGDLLPVSALPVDGTFPLGTAAIEKRQLAASIPVWEPDLCIDCGKCAIVCPHAAIRMKVFEPAAGPDAATLPVRFKSKSFRSRDLVDHQLTVQVAPDDCTGCGVCVDVCPAKDKTELRRKAINLQPFAEHADDERHRWEAFLTVPELDRAAVAHDSVKTSQLLQPLFEFSGACSGCGETPYIKLLTQLFGDRLVIANATGCSSIYGGNLPTTPYTTNAAGRGPAWANSLFEDNAEFGLGMRAGIDSHHHEARRLLTALAPHIGDDRLLDAVFAHPATEREVIDQRAAVATLKERLDTLAASAHATSDTTGHRTSRHLDLVGESAECGTLTDQIVLDAADRAALDRLITIADELERTSVWLVGGDGWAYDIGFGGLDHVLSTGRNVNVLVLDTEVYSNTGGQASKATPRAATAKFATSGKAAGKKDLGAIARSYGNVYVAQVALGGSDVQTVKALLEADAWDGPSLVIAYSTCIAHGIDMETSMTHQKAAVRSGYWPLYRFRPSAEEHTHPFQLDSSAPTIPVREFAMAEARFAMLARTDPERSDALLALAQADADERWRYYQQLAEVERTIPGAFALPADGVTPVSVAAPGAEGPPATPRPPGSDSSTPDDTTDGTPR